MAAAGRAVDARRDARGRPLRTLARVSRSVAPARSGRRRDRHARRLGVGRDRGAPRHGAARSRAAAGPRVLVVPPAERAHVRPRPRRQAGRLVPQPRRVEPVRGRGRAPSLRAAVLPRAPVARRDRRLVRRRVRADRRARPRLQRALPRGGRRSRPRPGVARGVPRRALLPVRDRPDRQARPRRDPSRAVVPARRRGGDRAGDDRSAVCHCASRQDVVVWPLVPIAATRAGG